MFTSTEELETILQEALSIYKDFKKELLASLRLAQVFMTCTLKIKTEFKTHNEQKNETKKYIKQNLNEKTFTYLFVYVCGGLV